MVLLVVWVVVLALAVVVLGGLAYGLFGALTRLRREVEGAEREMRPLLEQLQQTADRARQVSPRR